MFEYIKGTLESLTPAEAILENNGIGYNIQISLNSYTKLQNCSECRLYIYTVIREDMHQLYGFFDRNERDMFLMLISISGIGPNTARMMLSSMTPEDLADAVTNNDTNRIKSVKGIGLKTAQRVIIELKDKVCKSQSEELPVESVQDTRKREEALGALVMLGFPKNQADKVLSDLMKENPSCSLEQLIKQALKRF